MGPVVAPAGTVAVRVVTLWPLIVAEIPLKLTVTGLEKLVPRMMMTLWSRTKQWTMEQSFHQEQEQEQPLIF